MNQPVLKVGVNTLFLIPGEVGGSETYVRDILRHAVHRYPDIEWTLFTNVENQASFEQDFASIKTVRSWPTGIHGRRRPSRIIREQLQLPIEVKRAGVNVLWSPGYTAPVRVACPQVVSVLDMQYREFPEDLSPLALLVTRLLVPGAVHAARKVITLSRFSRDQILKYVRVAPEKIVPIHLAADAEFSEMLSDAEGRTRRANLIPAGPYILCVANTYPHKNVHTLVDAFGELAPQVDCHLVLVGSERRGEGLVKASLGRIRHADRVVRLKGLARRDLIALYQGAAVFAFPSLYEGFGLPVLEAMSAGVPVVTTERGPMREIGGDAVRYFDGSSTDLARQLDELLGLRGPARAEWVQHAKTRATSFTWEATADQTIDVLRGCLPGSLIRGPC